MFKKIQEILFNIVHTVWLIVMLLIGLCIVSGICAFLYSFVGMDIFGLPALF